MTLLPAIIQVLLLAIVLTASVTDIRERRIPNWLTFPAILVGFAVNIFLDPSNGFWDSLEGLGVALLLYIPLFALRAMGAGDVKLMAAVGTLVGPTNWLGIMFFTAIIGGVLAVIAVVRNKRGQQTWFNVKMLLGSLAHRNMPYEMNTELDVSSHTALRLPHAVSIAGGVICFLGAVAYMAPR